MPPEPLRLRSPTRLKRALACYFTLMVGLFLAIAGAHGMGTALWTFGILYTACTGSVVAMAARAGRSSPGESAAASAAF